MSALVRGALNGFVVAFTSLVIVTLTDRFEVWAVEGIVAFTVLPLLGAATSLMAWRRQRRTAAEVERARPRRPDRADARASTVQG